MPSRPTFDPYAVLQVVPTAEQEVIQAAYKALAFKYHPDRDATRRAAEKMAELNRAYAMLRDARSAVPPTIGAGARRSPGSRSRSPQPALAAPPPPVAATGSVLTLRPLQRAGASADLARHDPDYILWLSRHSSGIRFRTEIYGILRTMGVSSAA